MQGLQQRPGLEPARCWSRVTSAAAVRLVARRGRQSSSVAADGVVVAASAIRPHRLDDPAVAARGVGLHAKYRFRLPCSSDASPRSQQLVPRLQWGGGDDDGADGAPAHDLTCSGGVARRTASRPAGARAVGSAAASVCIVGPAPHAEVGHR